MTRFCTFQICTYPRLSPVATLHRISRGTLQRGGQKLHRPHHRLLALGLADFQALRPGGGDVVDVDLAGSRAADDAAAVARPGAAHKPGFAPRREAGL